MDPYLCLAKEARISQSYRIVLIEKYSLGSIDSDVEKLASRKGAKTPSEF